MRIVVSCCLFLCFLIENGCFGFTQNDRAVTLLNNIVEKCETFEQAKNKLTFLIQEYKKGKIEIKKVVESVSLSDLSLLIVPSIKLNGNEEKITGGKSIFNGAAVGRVCFSTDSIKKYSGPTILVKSRMRGDDLGNLSDVSGIWLLEEDTTSHAAIVIRVMNKPCVTMTNGVFHGNRLIVAGTEIKEGDYVTIDGTNGNIYKGRLDVTKPQPFPEFDVFVSLLNKINKMRVYANADLPEEVKEAYKYGADGVDARTEHMFFAPDRLYIFRRLLFAQSSSFYKKDFENLMLAQFKDFLELFKLSNGAPITVRLLDPPPHEFLPETVKDEKGFADSLNISLGQARDLVKTFREQNPMLGFRGARLLICRPDIIRLQCNAMFQAAMEYLKKNKNGNVVLRVCVPMIDFVEEIDRIRSVVSESYSKIFEKVDPHCKERFVFLFGIMVETPRISILSRELKNRVDFVSFGTNDLTALTFGMSRGDMAERYFDFYKKELVEEVDPFVCLDKAVMELIKTTKNNLEERVWCGLCGEQAIDERSMLFCKNVGLNSISVAPSMIPIAKLIISKYTLHLDI